MSSVPGDLVAKAAVVFAYLDNSGLQDDVLTTFLPFIQGRSLVKRQEHCDIVDLLGPDMESTTLEYKASSVDPTARVPAS